MKSSNVVTDSFRIGTLTGSADMISLSQRALISPTSLLFLLPPPLADRWIIVGLSGCSKCDLALSEAIRKVDVRGKRDCIFCSVIYQKNRIVSRVASWSNLRVIYCTFWDLRKMYSMFV